MELMEKVAYLKGMVDMADLDPAAKETKILAALIETLDEMAHTVQDLTLANAQMCDIIESIDEDLAEIEEDLYAEDDDEEEDYDFDEDDDDDFEYDEDLYEGDDVYEVTCPTCGETFEVDDVMLDEGEINCPECGELLEFDLQIEDPPEEESIEI